MDVIVARIILTGAGEAKRNPASRAREPGRYKGTWNMSGGAPKKRKGERASACIAGASSGPWTLHSVRRGEIGEALCPGGRSFSGHGDGHVWLTQSRNRGRLRSGVVRSLCGSHHRGSEDLAHPHGGVRGRDETAAVTKRLCGAAGRMVAASLVTERSQRTMTLSRRVLGRDTQIAVCVDWVGRWDVGWTRCVR